MQDEDGSSPENLIEELHFPYLMHVCCVIITQLLQQYHLLYIMTPNVYDLYLVKLFVMVKLQMWDFIFCEKLIACQNLIESVSRRFESFWCTRI